MSPQPADIWRDCIVTVETRRSHQLAPFVRHNRRPMAARLIWRCRIRSRPLRMSGDKIQRHDTVWRSLTKYSHHGCTTFRSVPHSFRKMRERNRSPRDCLGHASSLWFICQASFWLPAV